MIKKFIPLLLAITFCQLAKSQDCKTPFLGSKTLYKAAQVKNTAAPKGYSPVFINHVGRHGARHLTKDVNTTYIYATLLKADSAGALTPAGKSLKEKVLRLEKVEKKNFKSISAEGKSEQAEIAERMYNNYPAIFNTPHPVFNVSVTKEIRTTQTSDAFLSVMQQKIKDLHINRALNDTTLRFYDLSPVYLSLKETGPWEKELSQVKAAYHLDKIADRVTAAFFSKDFLTTMTAKNKADFTSDLFGFITICYSLAAEIKEYGFTPEELDMHSYMTCDELSTFGKIDDVQDFLLKGPSSNADAIQVKIATPLLVDFINTTDQYIATKSVNATFRFAHAETVSPYATLMNISQASQTTADFNKINKIWSAAAIVPLSANIQWVLYKKEGAEEYLVKFLLNENEVSIKGLSTKQFPYYNWKDVRAFYTKKIKSLGGSLEGNGMKFLQSAK